MTDEEIKQTLQWYAEIDALIEPPNHVLMLTDQFAELARGEGWSEQEILEYIELHVVVD